MPGVKILVTNVETGVTSAATTDSLGNFAVRFLPTGRYRLEAEAAGFKKFVRQDISLDVARKAMWREGVVGRRRSSTPQTGSRRRNKDKLNAGNFFTHQRPIVRYNQFGATIGGPIIKNKTFFFFGYQGTRDFGTSVYTNFTVPLPEFKNGDF